MSNQIGTIVKASTGLSARQYDVRIVRVLDHLEFKNHPNEIAVAGYRVNTHGNQMYSMTMYYVPKEAL